MYFLFNSSEVSLLSINISTFVFCVYWYVHSFKVTGRPNLNALPSMYHIFFDIYVSMDRVIQQDITVQIRPFCAQLYIFINVTSANDHGVICRFTFFPCSFFNFTLHSFLSTFTCILLRSYIRSRSTSDRNPDGVVDYVHAPAGGVLSLIPLTPLDSTCTIEKESVLRARNSM